MSLQQSNLFPLVEMQAVANSQHEWVALLVQVDPQEENFAAALAAVFGYPDMAAALAPMDCIVPIPDPRLIDENLLALMPADRIIPLLSAASLEDAAVLASARQLQTRGYRIVLDGPLPAGIVFSPLANVRLARGIDTQAQRTQALSGGANWLSGNYILQADPDAKVQDGTSRKRLLALLGLVARDAESRELETLLKQDPALSYHLLKLANSAAFGHATLITSFGQAINMLGRRQLQRWLQLLLYSRQQDDGPVNPLLPLAALRAAQMESLCKQQGGNRDEQDLAFMVGVFSLLDLLFQIPMNEIVAALNLDPEVERALLEGRGRLGNYLSLVTKPDAERLLSAEADAQSWWLSLLQGYHWAILVSRDI